MSDKGPHRVVAVDLGRGVALVGMIVFHAARDFEIFGLLPPGTTLMGEWAILARVVAGTFFFLSGVSLVLAHGTFIRWRSFIRRIGIVAGAALLVTIATYAADPERLVYFGILHSIAVCSVLALAFLQAPVAVTIVFAVSLFALHANGIHPLSSTLWSFTGLSSAVRPTLDLLPLVPWFAVTLCGVAAARLWRPERRQTGRFLEVLAWPGRHSLAIYLVHQPVLLALIWSTFFWAGG